MDLAVFAAFNQSIGLIKTTVQGMVDIRDFTKISEVRVALMSQISEALSAEIEIKQAMAKLDDENRELRNQVRQFTADKLDWENYEMHRFQTGMFAWKLKQEVESPTMPAHFCCVACKQAGRKSILQPLYEIFLKCAESEEHKIQMEPNRPIDLSGLIGR